MAVRPLIIGILFIGILVAIILSIGWIDKTQPVHQPDPLAPAASGANPTTTAPPPAQ
ncbi:hypothetical protein [Rhizobium sp. S163]|uniref:hypothetical protein n=1 Tax=Rhizobium sp. S163 TaxID=3055039 RepID=UPI0025A9A382|nr:hypothetical protein [Rhizobium sp. S163]MDM9648545.1 hypothetical protein [Rhizobium sp. S163]